MTILPHIVWSSEAGPGGGGGGGGNQRPEPPRRAERPGSDPRTVDVASSRHVSATPTDGDPRARLDLPAQSLASSIVSVAGALETLSDLPAIRVVRVADLGRVLVTAPETVRNADQAWAMASTRGWAGEPTAPVAA